MPDIGLGGVEAFHATLGLVGVAFHIHQNLRRAAIVGDLHAGHADQADAWIAEFTLDQRFNLLAQGFAQPSAMIFDRALLHFTHPRLKRKRISENRRPVLQGSGKAQVHCRAAGQNRDKYGGNNAMGGVAKLNYSYAASEIFNKRIGDLRAVVVGDAHGSPLDFLH